MISIVIAIPVVGRQQTRGERRALSSVLAILALACVAACSNDGSPARPIDQPAIRAGARAFLEVAPGGAVYRQDSTHCVVTEGRPVYWQVRRNEVGRRDRVRVRSHPGTATAGSDFATLDQSWRFGAQEDLAWSLQFACPFEVETASDGVAEPDEVFTLTVESESESLGVDPVCSTITITILDTDHAPTGDGSFFWPLEPGLTWEYETRGRSTSPVDGHYFCYQDSATVTSLGPVSYGGRTYQCLGSSIASGPLRVCMEGPKAWVIPAFAPRFPPDAADSIATQVWETYPRLYFDGADPSAECARVLDLELPFSSWDSARGVVRWQDENRCRGVTSLATPAGIFRHVICVQDQAGTGRWEGFGLSSSGGATTYWIADSVGVVAMSTLSWYDTPGGPNGHWSGYWVLTETTAGRGR